MSNRRFGALSSSTDPQRLAAWVTGLIISLSSLVVWASAHFFNLSITQTEVTQSAGQIGAALGSIWFLFGLIRKAFVAVHDKLNPQG